MSGQVGGRSSSRRWGRRWEGVWPSVESPFILGYVASIGRRKGHERPLAPCSRSRSYIAFAGLACPAADSVSDMDSAKARCLALLYRLTPIITTTDPIQHSTTLPSMSISLPPLHLSHTISYRITSYGIWRTYVPLFVTISQAPIPPPTYAYPDPPSVLRLPKPTMKHQTKIAMFGATSFVQVSLETLSCF